jgi:hypothetical protein
MKEKVIKELFRENLCTYFILPMLKLNKFRFVSESNFVNSFLSSDAKYIYVQVLETIFFEHRLASHPQFDGIFIDSHNNRFIRYKLPTDYATDIDRFCKGQFSKLSVITKKLINKYSGLLYKELNEQGLMVTDVRLLALDKSEAVKEMWEEYFDVCMNGMELLSIPQTNSYILDGQLTPLSVTV